MFADLTTTGYSHLCAEERGLAHFHVMGYLDEVIHLGILANDSRTHHRSVHTSVCSKLYIVLDDHITDLRNLTVDTLCIGLKAETICSDYAAPLPRPGENVPITININEGSQRQLLLWRMPSSSRAYPMKLEDKARYYQRVLLRTL